MSDTITFHVPGIPQTADSKRAFVIPGKNGGKPRAIVTDDNPKGKDWRATIQQVAADHFAVPMEGPLKVSLRFGLLRPKGHFGKRGLKPSAPQYPTVKPDVIKLARCVEDALNGLAWKDDSQIVFEELGKVYAGSPGVQIEIGGVP
jgi:Holliday junction resolvase RusA-like endonuclease